MSKDMPAFPCGRDVTLDQFEPSSGMTIRDYFAAKAMQAEFSTLYAFSQFEDCARSAYLMADAMLKERNKQHDTN